MTAEHILPRGIVETAEAILATELMEQRLRSLAPHRCPECRFADEDFERFLGHIRVTGHEPQFEVHR